MTYDDDLSFAIGETSPNGESEDGRERATLPEVPVPSPVGGDVFESSLTSGSPKPAEADGPLDARREGASMVPRVSIDDSIVSRGSVSSGVSPEGDQTKMGIVGGKGVGKSYLFQSMIYRTQAGERSGALAYYLDRDSIELFSREATAASGDGRLENLDEFLKSYESWTRLEATRLHDQRWYELRLGYRDGLLGGRRTTLSVEFLDGSGEGFFEGPLSEENLRIWRQGFLDAHVMVFCLPLWVAFPRQGLTDEDWEEREERLSGFQRVLGNFARARKAYDVRSPVQTILALTMADDGRSALESLRARWIGPYMDRPRPILKTLRRSGGMARYLENARRVSTSLRSEFSEAPEPRIVRIPQQLDLGAGEPWLIALSAVEGSRLDLSEGPAASSGARMRLSPPVPVHVELPLLVTLCERTNALM